MNLGNFTHNQPSERPGNWIAVSRDMRTHPVVGFGKRCRPAKGETFGYSRAEAWQDLVMEAQYQPARIEVSNATVWLDAGQLLGAREYLASRWNWTEKAVRTFLDRLEAEHMIRREQPNLGPATGQREVSFKSMASQKLDHLKGQLNSAKNKSLPNLITVCNYSRYQQLADAISDYVSDTKRASERANNGPATGQLRASAEFEKGPESNKEQYKQKIALNDSAGAPSENRSNPIIQPSRHNPEKNPDPFNLNPSRNHPDVIRSETGELTLLNGKRADWLKRFDGDGTGLDLALMQIADKVQPNSTRTIEVQVEAQLAGIIQRKREQDQRYLAAATRNNQRPKPPPGGAVMSLDERLQIERDRKAGITTQ